MKILVLSFYCYPDIGPGALRVKALINALLICNSKNLNVDVLTTMPNRYKTHRIHCPSNEIISEIEIKRFNLPSHKGRMLDQAWSFIIYAINVVMFTRGKQYDVVVATSSRLMTGVLGAFVAKRLCAKFYLDVRDLFADTIQEILHDKPLKFLIPIIRFLESWTFKSADKVNVVSPGFLAHIHGVAPLLSASVLTNGIDEEFIAANFLSTNLRVNPVILYAGNMGDGQGLHHIIPEVASAMFGQVNFKLIGDGGQRVLLEQKIKEMNLSNVQILDPVPRVDLIEEYRNADILFLHLNNLNAFRRVLPSKIFEYASTGKPILAGVNGCAEAFLSENVSGVELFDPCNHKAMRESIDKLLNGPKKFDRTFFCKKYSRQFIMNQMVRDILDLKPNRKY